MTGPETGRRRPSAERGRTGIAAVAVMLLAIVCCAVAPAILAVFGGVALGAVVGWAAGAAVLVAATILVIIGRRDHHNLPFGASRQTN